MAKKQHAFALLTVQAQAMIEPNMNQPSGATVTVLDNNGNTVDVPELHGGFTSIGEPLNNWRMILGCGMDFAFSGIMIAQLQQVGAQVGQPVGVLLAIVDDIDGTEQPDYSQLDVAMTAEAKAPVDVWLSAHGYDAAPVGTVRQVVEYVGGLFRAGFEVGQDSIS